MLVGPVSRTKLFEGGKNVTVHPFGILLALALIPFLLWLSTLFALSGSRRRTYSQPIGWRKNILELHRSLLHKCILAAIAALQFCVILCIFVFSCIFVKRYPPSRAVPFVIFHRSIHSYQPSLKSSPICTLAKSPSSAHSLTSQVPSYIWFRLDVGISQSLLPSHFSPSKRSPYPLKSPLDIVHHSITYPLIVHSFDINQHWRSSSPVEGSSSYNSLLVHIQTLLAHPFTLSVVCAVFRIGWVPKSGTL